MMYRQIFLLALISFSVGNIKAQQPLSVANISTSTSSTGNGKLYHATDQENQAARAIEFEQQTVTSATFLANINHYFAIPTEFSFVETESNTDKLGMRHRLMQQYHKGIPLEGLAYRVHERNGFVTSANGKAIREINIDVNTILTEEQAFDQAVQHLQTKDTTVRTGKKLIVSKDFTFAPESFSVAYQFDIDVSLIERWRISIDARDGQVINKVSLVNTCLTPPPPPPQYDTGTGLTNYYGSKTIRVTKADDGSSRLFGQTEHGGKIGTYDFKNKMLLVMYLFNYKGSDFYSSDNTYNLPYQQAAVSVQWAAEQTYEYFFTEHNRDSFDNNGDTITSYVHVDNDWDNAAWTGKVLVFGDGSNNNPPVELDVVSHEFSHGVTQYEAALSYQNEPGALNESFSDILAKAAEFTILGDAATWQLGRHFRDGGIRDMSNPNLKGQPDTYHGDMWYSGTGDYGGVHYNSGVQNFWFYLLCEGGSGMNDHGVSYSVNSIGMDTATNIAYRNLTEYLISSSDYLDSRIGSLLATADLYGKNSSAYQEVDKAWDAVGVIDEPIIMSLDLYDITATTVKLTGSLQPRGDSVTYHFEYGTTPELGEFTSIYDYTGAVEGIITGLQSETKYYVRLVSTNENGSAYATTDFTTISLAPLTKVKHIVDVTDTSAVFYGLINPNSMPTSFYFEYGPTPAMGLVTPSYPISDTTEFIDVSASVSDLQSRQTYHYKLVATNDFALSDTDSLSFFTALSPVITSFTPITATIGSHITIAGERFNPIPEKNSVRFGATRGTVLSSSSTELTVKVPAGASFGPISLVDIESALATESVQEFVPTFTDEFGKGNMQLRAAYSDFDVRTIEVQDMDGDGKPDIVASHNSGVTIFQNVNTGGDITNESFIPFNALVNNSFSFHSLVDVDGNGLVDIVGDYQHGIRIYPNYSVPGYIFFGVPVDLPIDNLYNIQFEDFDNDGRLDIAGYGNLPGDSTMFSIFKNRNPNGMLSPDGFEQRYSKIIPYWHFSVNVKCIGDLNNDGMPDLLLSNYVNDDISILINRHSSEVFEFEEIIFQDSVSGIVPAYFAQDLNQDGWKDITSIPTRSGKMMAFESKGNIIDFSKLTMILDGYPLSSLKPGDIDGDGKVDLLLGDNDGRFIFLENRTEASKPLSDSSFNLFEHYGIDHSSGYSVQSNVVLNDLNGDGRPEVINDLRYSSSNLTGNQLEIWQNSPSDCLDPSLVSVSDISRSSATIVLPPNTSLDDYEIAYTIAGTTDWQKVYETTLADLQNGALYQVRSTAKCYLGFTNYHYIDFTTECVNLESFSISDVQTNSIGLSASELSSFELQYSEAGKDEWIAISQYTDQIYDLLPGTTYDLRYRGRCYTPTAFNYTQFTTLCPVLSTLTVDDITYNQAVVNWTSSYGENAILEYSEDNVAWTSIDETQMLFPLIPGKEYFVRGKLDCTNLQSDFIHTSFIATCPSVSALTADAITPFSASIHWVDESHTGSYTIKYSTTDGGVKTAVTNSTSFYADGLDPGTQYSISVAPECTGDKAFVSTTFTTVCYVPIDLSVDVITHTSAELFWNADYSGPPYSIDYSIVGSDIWATTGSVLTKVSLEELRPGTEYEARVHINCLSVTAPYVSVRFETSLYGETVFAPNPTDNLITIFPSKSVIGNYFSIYDAAGRKVADGKLLDYTIDLSVFAAGIYILKIDGEAPVKVIKR